MFETCSMSRCFTIQRLLPLLVIAAGADNEQEAADRSSEEQGMLLEILSEKGDVESLHLHLPLQTNSYSLQYILRNLEEINAKNPRLHDVTLVIQGKRWGNLANGDV